jgi:hypothetical protein
MRTRFLALLLLAAAAPAGATVFLPADFRDMVAGSRAIVHGRIVDVRSQTSGDRRTIATYVTVSVEQHLKGALGREVTFRVPGGEVGRYRRVIVGAPRFDRGDEVVLFLTSRGPSIPYLFGLSQGVYRVSRTGGTPVVTPPAVLAKGAAAERVVRGDPARRPLPLDAFAREVRALAESAR